MKLSVKLKCPYSVQHYLLTVDDVMWTLSTLHKLCNETKQPNFNCRTFSLTDIIKTLTISHANNYSNN